MDLQWIRREMENIERTIRDLSNGPITMRYEHDSSTIRLRFGYNTLQHATRFFVRSHSRSYTRISGRRVLHVD